MISSDSVTKAQSTVVFVVELPTAASFLELTLQRDAVAEIIVDPEIAAQQNNVTIASMASQIQMVIEGGRIVFRDRSDSKPTRPDFAERVVRLTRLVAETNMITFSRLGLNFDVQFRPPGASQGSASRFILERFVRQDSLTEMGYPLTGASVRLWYEARDARHYLYIEPKGNDYDADAYHSHVNVTYTLVEPDIPEVEWLTQAIQEEYDDFLQVLSTTLTR